MRRAFTLIELLVVIAIIAILAAILFPVFAQAKDSAKNTAALSNCKELGLAFLMYATDYDDMLPPDAKSDGLGWDTWQGMIQPYTKNWQIVTHPKLPPPSGIRAYWQRLLHWGYPQRAIANTGSNSTLGYYPVPRSIYWTTIPSSVATVKVDGIGGAGVDLAGGYTWYASQGAPSLSQTQIENISDIVMISEAGNWDYWWGVFQYPQSGVMPLRMCGMWLGTGWAVIDGYWAYGGPHARKKPMPDGTTSGDASGLTPGCSQPKGLSTFCAADGSAKSAMWRGELSRGQMAADGTWYMYHFWPKGG